VSTLDAFQNSKHTNINVCCVSDGASKHALQAFCDSLRAEVDGHGITVSVISPGYIRTNLSVNALTTDGTAYGSKLKRLLSVECGVSAVLLLPKFVHKNS